MLNDLNAKTLNELHNVVKFISLFEFCDGYQLEISFGEIKWRNE